MDTNCKYKIIFKDGSEEMEISSPSSEFKLEDFLSSLKQKFDEDPKFKEDFNNKFGRVKNERYITNLNISNIVATTSLNEIIKASKASDRHPTGKMINDSIETLRDFIVQNDSEFNPNTFNIVYTSIKNSLEDKDLFAGKYDKETRKLIINKTTALGFNNITVVKNLIDYAIDLVPDETLIQLFGTLDIKEAIRLLPNTIKDYNGLEKSKPILTKLSSLVNIPVELLELVYTSHLKLVSDELIGKYTGKTADDLYNFNKVLVNKFQPMVAKKGIFYSKTEKKIEQNGFKLEDILNPGMLVTIPARINTNDREFDMVFSMQYGGQFVFLDVTNNDPKTNKKYFKKSQLQYVDKETKEIYYKVKTPMSTDNIYLSQFNYQDVTALGNNIAVINRELNKTGSSNSSDYKDVIKSLTRGDYFAVIGKSNNVFIYKVFERNDDNVIYGDKKSIYSSDVSRLDPIKIIKYLDNITEQYDDNKFNFRQNLYEIPAVEAKTNDVVQIPLFNKDGSKRLDLQGKEIIMTALLVGVGDDTVTILTRDTEYKKGFGIQVPKSEVKKYYRNYNGFKDNLDHLYKNLDNYKNWIVDFKNEKRISPNIDVHLIDTSDQSSNFIKNKLLALKEGDIVEVDNNLWVISNVKDTQLELINYAVSQKIINGAAFTKKEIEVKSTDLSKITTIIGNSDHVYSRTIKKLNEPLIMDENDVLQVQGDTVHYQQMYLVSNSENPNMDNAVWKDVLYFNQDDLAKGILSQGIGDNKKVYTDLTKLYLQSNKMSKAFAPFVKSSAGNSIKLHNILGYVTKRLDSNKLDDFKNKIKSGTYIEFYNDFNIYRIEEVTDKGLILSFFNNNTNGTKLNLTKFTSWESINDLSYTYKGKVKHLENINNKIYKYYIPHTSAFIINDFAGLGTSIYNEESFKLNLESSDSTTVMNEIKNNIKKRYKIQVVDFKDSADLEFRKKYKIPENLAKEAKAFAYDGKIFMSESAGIDDIAHEFMHLLLGSLKMTNFDLYEQILSIKMPDSYVAAFDKQFENEYSGLSGLERKEEIFVRAFGDQVMNISSIKNIVNNTELDNILLGLIHQFLGIVTPKAGIAIDVFGKSLKQLLNENGTELLNPESLYDKSASITGLQISNLKEVLEIKCE